MPMTSDLTRREFLKFAGVGLGSLTLLPRQRFFKLADFPPYERLGRVCVGKVELRSRPDQDSPVMGVLYEDAVLPWLHEVVGRRPYYINQRWVETPDGYIYASYLQPVRNQLNLPTEQLIDTSLGEGMWAEVTVPYVDVILENKPSRNSWVEARVDAQMPVRLYYGQVFWVDRIRKNDQGNLYYRVNPNYYGGLDMLWARAEAFRPIGLEEITPIHPEVEDKRVVIDILHQTLSCFEGNTEVFFCRVSTGAKYDASGNPVDVWSTPLGKHRVTRKYISLQMSGGTTGSGWDFPGIGWTSIFVTGGVAIHSTFWHNDYGVPRSRGCINVRPEDAKWIFRWVEPFVLYDNGSVDVTVTGDSSTSVEVREG